MNNGTASSEAETMALRSDVVSTVLDPGAILLDLETKYFYTVNASGWAVLQLLEQGASRHQIEAQCASWGMPATQQGELDRFLERLVGERLVETGAGGGPLQPVALDEPWSPPEIDKQKEPLQRLMASAFDPSLPLAE
ncbi:MAG TPA: PqqD family protein [Geminicoccaceae bacterium]|nr:PqqD family protein [Geminicoccaceae bacterium]